MVISNQLTLDKPSQWLLWCIMAYFIMNGAQLWETAIIIPAWTAAPPASLHFFQTPYGIDFKVFWIVMHSVHEIIFIMVLILNWKDKQLRIPLLMLFIAHMGVRAWTLMYFAPTLMWFQSLPVSDQVDQALVEKAALWRNLNFLRVALFFTINILLVFLWKNRKQV